jgi:hypothetical protein
LRRLASCAGAVPQKPELNEFLLCALLARLCFLERLRSSTFKNLDSVDLLLDMPDPIPAAESGSAFAA